MNRAAAALMFVLGCAGSVKATEVIQHTFDKGFFTPFNAPTPPTVRECDSGRFGTGSDAPVGLTSITLGLAKGNSTREGSADLALSLHDGDPSGLVFGSSAQLFSTSVRVTPPDAAENGGPATRDLGAVGDHRGASGGMASRVAAQARDDAGGDLRAEPVEGAECLRGRPAGAHRQQSERTRHDAGGADLRPVS